jgi:hypothetical protein
VVGHRFPVTSAEAGRREYGHHSQTNDKDPGGQEDERVIRERLGGPSGLRIEVTATLKRVLSSI